MNNRRLSLGLVFVLTSALAAACGGSEPPADNPPAPTGTPADTAAPTAMPAETATASAAPSASAASTAAAEAPPPAPKPAKEKVVGRWVADFGSEKAKAEEDAKKKAGKADKDGSKAAALVKAAQEKFEKKQVEATADGYWIQYDGDKQVAKVKFEVSKDDGGSLTVKLGKDEVAKKDLKGKEVTITFKDDSTIEAPDLKDAKNAMVTFKKK